MSHNEPRISFQDFQKFAPETVKSLRAMTQSAKASSLDPKLLELIEIRASQMNGCAFCLHMHIEEAQKLGETFWRLQMLNAWRETSIYSERAALAWTESMTLRDNSLYSFMTRLSLPTFNTQRRASFTSSRVAV